MGVISAHLKELWEEWELRALVLLSLAIQVLLIVLGHQRKYRHKGWVRALVWSCYLAADGAAIYALGKIATRLNQIRRDLGAAAAAEGLDPNAQMIAFWAPFLLLHLGGPDTITAYSLEDNELWPRHLLGLFIQMVGTLLIFFQALTGSDLSVLSLFMIFSGLIKYGERVYVLRAVSSKQFRDSIPDPPLYNLKILEEFKLKEAEGYDVTPHEVIEVCGPISEYDSTAEGDLLLSPDGKISTEELGKRNRAELAIANDLIDICYRLFVDLTLGSQDRNTSLLILRDKHYHVVFRVIEIELGLMYDLLYTKAKAIHNRWGIILRAVSILLTGMVLVLFSLSDKEKYSKFNISVTFLLLWVAIFLEIYASFVLLFSDKAACWLKNHSPVILDFVERLQPLHKRRRWSGFIAQFDLLSFALSKKHLPCYQILELLPMHQKVLKFLYRDDVKIENFLKERVIEHVKSQVTSQKEVLSVWNYRGDLILGQCDILDNFKWSIDLEFDQSILVWHIATELLYRWAPPKYDSENKYCEMSKQLSRYMLYLLVMYPFLLPIGVGRSKFRDTHAEVVSLFNEKDPSGKAISLDPSGKTNSLEAACKRLKGDLDHKLADILVKGEKSNFTLYHGCRLALQLDGEITNQEEKWYILSLTWVEMLAYAAVKCKGLQHAQQLRRGGEFLTHVWLLMAHFGLTDHFQIQHAPAIADMLVKQE